MKKHVIAATLLLLAVCFALSSCAGGTDTNGAVANRDIVTMKEFMVATALPDANTTAQGTIYLQNKQGKPAVTIVGSVVIGEDDWGGVAFYIPSGWSIASVLSSYPGGGDASDHTVIWNTADTESQWRSYVEIGHNQTQTPTGGGTGTLLIELTKDESAAGNDTFSLLVSAGSEMKNGVPIVGTASTLVEIDID